MSDGFEIPDLIFKTLCKNDKCRAPLGGFHMTCVGLVLFVCHKCGNASAFKNDVMGIKAKLVGPVKTK